MTPVSSKWVLGWVLQTACAQHNWGCELFPNGHLKVEHKAESLNPLLNLLHELRLAPLEVIPSPNALEETFGLPPGGLGPARTVLRDYGNMSAVTVLFVLKRLLGNCKPGRYLMSALGPGFTAGFQLMHVT